MSVVEIVNKVWNYAHVLRDDGVGYGDYVEQITYLIFLKMADERERAGQQIKVLDDFIWSHLVKLDGDDLELQYSHPLENLGKQGGMLGTIFRKAKNKIQDPAKLERNAQDVKGGAGQYFTPRPLIQTMVDVMQPKPTDTVANSACGIDGDECPISANDALAKEVGDDRVDRVLANPPFGKKSSITVINEKTGND